ncbi:hypothetical protein UlMin_021577 [Ulmus minor]
MLVCLIGLHKRARTLFHQLNSVLQFEKRKPSRNFWSSVNVSSSEFAAMEVSNQFRQVFEMIDSNGDGKVSSSELSEVLLCLGYKKKSVAAKEADIMIREMDFNGDGFIDLDEFMDALNSSSGISSCGEEEHEHLKDAFLVFDSDKNGKISAKELQSVLVKLGCDKCSLKECRRMIKGVDKDGDGFVNFEEFRLMMTKDST